MRGRFALPERVQLFRRTSISGDKPDGGGCTCEVKVAAGSWKVSGVPLANRVAAGGDRLNDNDTRFNLNFFAEEVDRRLDLTTWRGG